jgi:HK97 family phage major capsid protein
MSDIKALTEQLNSAFEQFKAEHTAQLESVKKGQADALQALKVDKINADIGDIQAAIDKIAVAQAAAEMGGAGRKQLKDAEYTEAFMAHVRRGDIQANLNKGAAAEGGYLAPTEWDRTIIDKLVLVSPMRQLAAVQSISTPNFTKLWNLKGAASGWVGETAARPETATPTFGPIVFSMGEIYANPAATQGMLDDSEISLESWLAGEVQEQFAYQENIAFLTGNGTSKPQGLLNFATGGTAAAVHPGGAIPVVVSGSAAALTADGLMDLIHALPSKFTGNARFAFNRNTQAAIRKLKDGQNQYLWAPGLGASQPASLLGYPITEVPDMPAIAANALPVAFGDFKQTYQIIDRVGIRILRDPYTNKPYVHFYTTKRVGGGLLNPETMRFQKCSV